MVLYRLQISILMLHNCTTIANYEFYYASSNKCSSNDQYVRKTNQTCTACEAHLVAETPQNNGVERQLKFETECAACQHSFARVAEAKSEYNKAMDYALLGEHPAPALKLRKAAAAAAGLLLLGSSSLWFSKNSATTDSRSTTFVPNQGVEAVLVRPGPVGPLPLSGWSLLAGPQAIFVHADSPLAQQLNTDGASSEPACLYGVRLLPEPTVTGKPEDVLCGSLMSWPSSAFKARLQQADALMGYNPAKPYKGRHGRAVSRVVQRDGQARKAYWYYTLSSIPTKENFRKGENEIKPAWAGANDLLSKLVNVLIDSPLYALMKPMARRTLIKTAEENGIPWREDAKAWEAQLPKLEQLKAQLEDKSIKYPVYYTMPFHAYDTGNLEWLAAFECESATKSMTRRLWPDEQGLTWQTAQDRMRYDYFDRMLPFMPAQVRDVLDLGCSVGMSTTYLLNWLEKHGHHPNMIGLDLSPYFLAIAQYRSGDRIKYVHGLAEDTKLPDQSQDLITMQLISHELPRAATKQVFAEVHRLLRCGGLLALMDSNPRSAIIRSLPPALFTLMKSTEPHSDDYYQFNMEEALMDQGFDWLETSETDPRHRTVLARKEC
eukprot:g22822.t1